jgi:hypothetical protein
MILVFLLAATGCSRGNARGRLPISGTVTLDGQPLESGYITFEPKGTQNTQAGASIVAGKFEIPQPAGAAPGHYAVAVMAGAGKPLGNLSPGTPEYEAAALKKDTERIPRKYNVKTTLVADVQTDGENVFTFNLTSK